MQDLRLVGVSEDSAHLILAAGDGTRFRVPLDSSLKAAVRHERPRQVGDDRPANLSPREVQALIRAGASAAEVAELAGWSMEKVAKYEAPIVAEREYVASLATAVRLSSLDAGAAPTLGARVAQRLVARGVDPDSASWDAWRAVGQPWMLVLMFGAGGRLREARWQFDVPSRTVTPHDDEARWLSEDEAPSAPAPFVPVRQPVSSRPGGLDPQGGSAGSVSPAEQPTEAADLRHGHRPDHPSTRGGRAGDAAPVTETSPGGPSGASGASEATTGDRRQMAGERRSDGAMSPAGDDRGAAGGEAGQPWFSAPQVYDLGGDVSGGREATRRRHSDEDEDADIVDAMRERVRRRRGSRRQPAPESRQPKTDVELPLDAPSPSETGSEPKVDAGAGATSEAQPTAQPEVAVDPQAAGQPHVSSKSSSQSEADAEASVTSEAPAQPEKISPGPEGASEPAVAADAKIASEPAAAAAASAAPQSATETSAPAETSTPGQPAAPAPAAKPAPPRAHWTDPRATESATVGEPGPAVDEPTVPLPPPTARDDEEPLLTLPDEAEQHPVPREPDLLVQDEIHSLEPSAQGQPQSAPDAPADAEPESSADAARDTSEAPATPAQDSIAVGPDETAGEQSSATPKAAEPVPAEPKPAPPKPAPPKKRSGRTSVPSWDDVMFGSRRD